MSKKKYIVYGVIVGILAIIAFVWFTGIAGATFIIPDQCVNKPGYQASVPDGYHQGHAQFSHWCFKDKEPEVTPTPEWDGKQGTATTFAGSSTETPRCGDGSTSQVVANAHVVRNGSYATVNFFITEGDSANLYWKVVTSNDWQNAVSNLKPNEDKFVTYTVNDLNPDLGYSFGIQQKSGCGGGLITSVIVDPPANGKIFRVSYFE